MLVRVVVGRLNLKLTLRNRYKNGNSCGASIGRDKAFPFCTSSDTDRITRLAATATATATATARARGDPYSSHDEFLERPSMHSLVKSLLQVFSISVHTFGLDKEKACDIYGCVRVTQGQGQGSSFTLYDRDPANTQTIFQQGNLSLIGPSSAHVSGTTPTSIDFFLKDKTRDITIVNTCHDLHFGIDSYDKLRKDIIQGDHGFVSMCYVPWRFAVLATVEVVILQKKFDTKNPFSQVYGTVLAGYAHIKSSLKDDDDLENMRSILLSKSFDEAVQATVAEPLCLSRSVVAVPPYASLDIQVQLWNSYGQLASGSVEFIADCWLYCDTKTIEGDGGVVAVKVKCHDAFSDIYKKNNLGNRTQSFAGMKETSDSKRMLDAPRDFPMPSGGNLPSSITASRSLYSSANMALYEDSGEPMVEIFSIFVSGFAHAVSALCGKIWFCDGRYPRFMYERNFSNPELFSPDRRIITLEGPCDVDDSDFDLFLYLKDPVSGLEICNGWILWGPPRYDASVPYHDTRLCSIVQGANGYAAVYYTIFSSAFRAYLEMKVISKDASTVCGNICGCVLACYSTHDYVSTQDKQFYRSIIFDKPQLEAMELTTESNIPLSKFSVAVPSDSSLIIEADLRLECIGNKNHGVVSGSLEFEVDLSDKILKEIEGEHYCLLVSVKFYD